MEFALWSVGIVITLLVTLHIRNIHMRANAAHDVIEAHRVERKADERKVYERIKAGEDNMHTCRADIDTRILDVLELLRKMMPQHEVKDFVDREFKPVHRSLAILEEKAEKGNELTASLLTKVQVLLDRDNKE